MEYLEKAPQEHILREKKKAHELKNTRWWKQKLQEGVCYYCHMRLEKKEATMDHKVPLSRGGVSSRSNVVLSCKPCNAKKKYWTPAEIILQSKKS